MEYTLLYRYICVFQHFCVFVKIYCVCVWIHLAQNTQISCLRFCVLKSSTHTQTTFCCSNTTSYYLYYSNYIIFKDKISTSLSFDIFFHDMFITYTCCVYIPVDKLSSYIRHAFAINSLHLGKAHCCSYSSSYYSHFAFRRSNRKLLNQSSKARCHMIGLNEPSKNLY